MAIATAMRVQDNLLSIGLTSLALERLADRYCGSRAVWPDLPDQSSRCRFALRREVSSAYVLAGKIRQITDGGQGLVSG